MNVNEQRHQFFVKARQARYVRAKRVDPGAVIRFERRVEERRKHANDKQS